MLPALVAHSYSAHVISIRILHPRLGLTWITKLHNLTKVVAAVFNTSGSLIASPSLPRLAMLLHLLFTLHVEPRGSCLSASHTACCDTSPGPSSPW